MQGKTFLQRLSEPSAIILDGATGTELKNRGVNTGLPLWSSWALIDSPQVLGQIHYDYLKAGAEVITTNSFRTHRRSLDKAGMGERSKELTAKAVSIAVGVRNVFEEEGGHKAWVAGSISPLEDCYSPNLVPLQNDCEIEHLEIATNLAEAGADIILIETMNCIREATAALKGAKPTGLPTLVSFVLNSEGNLLSGETLEEMIIKISPFSPDMVGINCTPTQTIEQSLKRLISLTNIPVYAYGNIGHTDTIDGWTNTEDVSHDEYNQLTNKWVSLGAKMIGGCCGTSPEYIQTITKESNK